MRKMLLFVTLLSALTMLLTAIVFGWGATAHRFINRKAIINLPNSMASFKADSLFYEAHASDADNRKVMTDTSFFAEYWRHFIDIDHYANYESMPHELQSVITAYGRDNVRAWGTLPWATVMVVDSLTAQLARRDPIAPFTASDL